MKMNLNKIILEVSYLFCYIGPTAILIVKNRDNLLAVIFGIVSIVFLIYMFWYIFISHKDKF